MARFLVVNTDVSIHPLREVDIDRLSRINADLLGRDCRTAEQIIDFAGKAHGILTAEAPLSARVIDALTQCRVIVRYGIGVDNIDVDAATRRGIPVANVPDFCVDEVSDHTICLLLAGARKLLLADRLVRQGGWGVDALRPIHGLRGQTLGLIGLGRIGTLVAKKAISLALHVIAHDPSVAPETMAREQVSPATLDEVLTESDFLSLHLPLNAETRHTLGEEELKRMKPTAMLINTSRGGIVDEMALIEALQTGRIAHACLDVFETEPPDRANALLKMDNVTLTPHSAACSETALADLRERAVTEIVRVLRGDPPLSAVNPQVKGEPG